MNIIFRTGVKSLNLLEHGSVFGNVNLKCKSTNWIKIDFHYSINYPMLFPKEKMSQSLCRNILVSKFKIHFYG